MLVAVASVKGSPGVTTFAVALAACWPAARRVVVEADAAGGDLAARFGLRPVPGLVSLAAEVRTASRPDGELVWRHAQWIGDGVFVVAAPPGAAEAAGALGAMTPGGLAALQVCAADPETLIVVDCGRLGPDSPTVSATDAADALLVLSGAHADDLAHLPSRLATLGRGCRQRRLLLVGEGYPTAEVERELGIRVAARIPHDVHAAAALRGLGPGRGRRSGLVRAAERCAHSLLTRRPDRAGAASEPASPRPVRRARWRVARVGPVTGSRGAVVVGNGARDGQGGASHAEESGP